MKRAVVVLLVLTASLAVQGAPENADAPTTTQDSECYDCHQPGGEGEGPILSEMFRMFLAEAPDLEPGASTELTFDIRNWWTSELQGFNGYIDLKAAPAFSFEPARDPISRSREGTLPEYEPAAYFQRTARHGQSSMDVDAGGTDLILTLTPEEGSNADLELWVWAPGMDRERDQPLYQIDQGGDGEPETLILKGDPVQGGQYLVDAVEEPDTFATSPDMFDAIGFRLDWTLSFEFKAGDPVRSGATLVVLDGQGENLAQNTTVSWPVNIVRNITAEQRIRVYMESVSYYDHPPQFRAVDEWWFWGEVEYVITPQDDGSLAVSRITPSGDRVTEFIVGEQVVEVATPDEEQPDLTAEEEQRLDVFSEVVGYGAGFLLVVSLVTGGAFGNWSRKLQQWMLYRRAKKRVAFHNVVSYGLIVAAVVHMVLFLIEPKYPWSVGFFLGGVSIFGMLLSGITGAFQRPMVRGMGHEAWRWLHYLSFVLAFAGAAGHILLDGIHFAEFQQTLAWEDPVAPVLEEWIPPADPVVADTS